MGAHPSREYDARYSWRFVIVSSEYQSPSYTVRHRLLFPNEYAVHRETRRIVHISEYYLCTRQHRPKGWAMN
jgi:hypothetical protein